jgi:hypothetical protein
MCLEIKHIFEEWSTWILAKSHNLQIKNFSFFVCLFVFVILFFFYVFNISTSSKKKKLKKIQHNNPPQTLDSDLGVGSPQHSGLVVD